MSNLTSYSSIEEEFLDRFCKGREETKKLEHELIKLHEKVYESTKPLTDRQTIRFDKFHQLCNWITAVDYIVFYTEDGDPKSFGITNSNFFIQQDLLKCKDIDLDGIAYESNPDYLQDWEVENITYEGFRISGLCLKPEFLDKHTSTGLIPFRTEEN